MPVATVIDDPAVLEALVEPWDALAVASERPWCTPAWMLAYWHEIREGDARLRAIVLRDGDEVVAVAPFFAQVSTLGLTEYRLLGAGISHRIGVVCRAGQEKRLARPLAAALAALEPRPSSIVWEGVAGDDPWPALVARHWPGRLGADLRRDSELVAPAVELPKNTSYEEWFGALKGRFRRQLTKEQRGMEEAGVRRRGTNPELLEDDLHALLRLHETRWDEKGGGSGAINDRVERAWQRMAPGLLAQDRLWLVMLVTDEQRVGGFLYLRAGGEVTGGALGFDPAFARLAPGRQMVLGGIEECFRQGVRRLDLGGGDSHYKRRFANLERPVVWRTVFPRGRRYPLTRLQLAPKQLRYGARNAVRRLPSERQEQLRRIVRR